MRLTATPTLTRRQARLLAEVEASSFSYLLRDLMVFRAVPLGDVFNQPAHVWLRFLKGHLGNLGWKDVDLPATPKSLEKRFFGFQEGLKLWGIEVQFVAPSGTTPRLWSIQLSPEVAQREFDALMERFQNKEADETECQALYFALNSPRAHPSLCFEFPQENTNGKQLETRF